MSRSTLIFLAIALAAVLGVLLWTFDRADMPTPTRNPASAPAATPSGGDAGSRLGTDLAVYHLSRAIGDGRKAAASVPGAANPG